MPVKLPVLGVWKPVETPAGFGWAHGLTIQRKGRRFRAKTFNLAALAPAAAVSYYVKVTGGSDADTGLSWDHALASVQAALGKADVDRIYVQAGTYSRNFGWNDVNLTRSCSVIGVGGQAVLSTRVAGLAWSLTAGKTVTYQAARTNVQGVFDMTVLNANGDYTRYTNVADVDTVEATAGSWTQAGALVHVHTPDGRAADANVFVSLIQYNGDAIGNITVYLENLTFQGGITALRFTSSAAGQTPALYAKNCKFQYSTNGNGVTLTGIRTAILQGCEASSNLLDGFNHHAGDGIVPRVIEIDCVSRDNGVTAADTSNGSSCHDGGSVLRLNGRYYRNKGPNVVEDGALESWNLGARAYQANAGAAGQDVDFMMGTSGTMWLDRCNSYGSENGLVAGAGTTIHKRKCGTAVADSGGGTIDSY
jgi:hypothetical protein